MTFQTAFESSSVRRLASAAVLASLLAAVPAAAQEAQRRWETMRQIRLDKFDLVLPEVMRENGVDMWITMIREANYGSLHADFGEGYTGDYGFYIFTDRGGDRIERAALGIGGYKIEQSGAYDLFRPATFFTSFVKERQPKTIALNYSRNLGPADTLSYSGYQQILELLPEELRDRVVSSEKLVSDFRSRRVATEIAAFAEAGEISRELAERALSNEVIAPGETRLEEVAWWLNERLFERGLGSSFGMPSIYVTGPNGVEAVSNGRIVQRGDVLMIDWGVGLMNLYTDMKRIAYVLREGETRAPESIQEAFDRAVEARGVIKRAIRAGIPAAQAEEEVYAALEQAGFRKIGFNQPTDDESTTDVVIGCHSVGNTGHGIGPSIAFFNPVRLEYELRPTNLLSIELFAYTAIPEWGGKKLRVPLEDDAVLTERGVEWLYPANRRILLIR
ncbi:MAG: M24 family metallopeptidase [Acidobacteriota bacterium]